MRKTLPDHRTQARRAALNALKRARRASERTGVALSEWEGEFLVSLEDRIKMFGRAFGDPEKGAPGQALSMLQAVKLKEISLKAKGGRHPLARKPMMRHGRFSARATLGVKA